MSKISLSLHLASCLPPLSFSTFTWAKLESSCQSKQYFYENIVHITTTSMMHCTFLIYTHSLSYCHSQRGFLSLCVVYFSCQLKSFVMIFKKKQSYVWHLCKLQNSRKRNRWIFSSLFKWGRRSCCLVSRCNKMIVWWLTAPSWRSDVSDVVYS